MDLCIISAKEEETIEYAVKPGTIIASMMDFISLLLGQVRTLAWRLITTHRWGWL